MNILIIDDDTALVAMLALHFEECGFTVCKVHNCRDTRALIRKRIFDLAVVDYQLPDGTGLELLKTFRETTPDLKVIMMSGIDDQKLKDRMGLNNLQYFLRKPIESSKLDAIVRKAFNIDPTT